MNSAFNSQILAEKLKKLDNSQQSIETLSHWCIFHRKKARLVVETWERQFRELPKEQQIPFLYLANDILQNSRHKGGEYVTEFWKILPGTLKNVLQKGDEQMHNVVSRLVDIWNDRKVFGSKTKTFREELLGKNRSTGSAEDHIKSNYTIRIKVPIGGIQEKLASAYQAVHNIASDEDAALGRCNAVVTRIEALEKEVGDSRNLWEPRAAILSEELQEQEFILNQCAEQLEISELTHAALLSHLKEALAEQESKLEIIRSQLQIVRIKAERSAILRRQLSPSGNVLTGNTLDHGPQETGVNVPGDTSALQKALSSGDATLSWSMSTFTSDQATLEEEVKDPRTAAAEIAAKLAASASSAQMLQSVLSSFVAEASLVSRVESAPLEQPTHLTPDKQQKLIGQDDNMTKDDGNHSNVKYSVPMFPLSNIGIPQQADSGHAPASLITSTVTSLNPPSHPILLSHPQYRGHDAIIHVQGYGYGSTSVSTLPSFSSIQQQQIVMAVTPSSSISSHNSNRIELKSIQQSGVHYYGQLPLPAPHFTQQ